MDRIEKAILVIELVLISAVILVVAEGYEVGPFKHEYTEKDIGVVNIQKFPNYLQIFTDQQ